MTDRDEPARERGEPGHRREGDRPAGPAMSAEPAELAEPADSTERPEHGRQARKPRLRIDTDAEAVQRDLSRLVLTLVELVRQLVERQSVRRMEQGNLTDEQVEQLGLTLMRLEEAMDELCERFDLSPSDLNLDLGPLGTLLPED
ncbi:gas vesicle protein K [Nonomuraea pusilla]|uniref:Gas vesicle protein K n=1 Tax=Nonomuraea pusilla TaxID=46177 RepID=A0A1H8B6U4_9ACTN|nr:gas vesicle protein K [Nonomuraea pusilla]SEM78039.1 Gas vesicle protein K [Nonomuraea pusilla]